MAAPPHQKLSSEISPPLPVTPAPASLARRVLSVRGALLTVRMDRTLWVLRAGADPRAWKKPLDRKGNGTGPWEPARPPLDDLLRVPEAFPPAADEWIAQYRQATGRVASESEKELAHHLDEEISSGLREFFLRAGLGDFEPSEDPESRVVWMCGHEKGTRPFPWAWVPGAGERVLRTKAPEPESKSARSGTGERPPSRRQRKRIPSGWKFEGFSVRPPMSLRDDTYRALRSTIRRANLLRRELPAWVALFPEGSMAFVERHGFSTRRWHLLNLWLRVPGGRQLWDDLPALAWLAASSWLCKAKPVKRPFRSLRALVRKPRACLLRWLDLPAGEGTLTLLRAVPPWLMTPKFAHALCRVLRDEGKRRTFRNLLPEPPDYDVLSLLAYDNPVSFPILRLISRDARIGPVDRRQYTKGVYDDCLKMIRLMEKEPELGPSLARIRSGERLVAFHDELVADLNRLGPEPGLTESRLPSPRGPWGPPIPPAPWMVPLRTGIELVREGREMDHCVASYVWEVAAGSYYVYAIHHGQHGRATLGLEREDWGGPGWRISQLRGIRNQGVSEDLKKAVDAWLKEPPGPRGDSAFPETDSAQLWLWEPGVGCGVPSPDLPTTVGLDARVPLPYWEHSDGDQIAEVCEEATVLVGRVYHNWEDTCDEAVDELDAAWEAYRRRIARFRPIAAPDCEEDEPGNWDEDDEEIDEWDEADRDTGERLVPEAAPDFRDAMTHYFAWSLGGGDEGNDNIPF